MKLSQKDYTLSDAVYGTVDVSRNRIFVELQDSVLEPLISTQEVCRTHWLRQAMFLYKEFAGATHSRYSHSIGCWIVGLGALEQLYVVAEGKDPPRIALGDWLVELGKCDRECDIFGEAAQALADPSLKSSLAEIRRHVKQGNHILARAELESVAERLSAESHEDVQQLLEDRVQIRDSQTFLGKYVKGFMAAALLHDIGHAPFSHAIEYDFRAQLDHHSICEGLIRGLMMGPVEYPTNWQANVDYLLTEEGRVPRGKMVFEVLSAQQIQDVTVNILYGAKASDDISTQEAVLHELIDGEFDLDRVDHILRDSYFLGIKLADYRIDTLLQNMSIVTKQLAPSKYKQIEASGGSQGGYLLVQRRGLPFLEYLLLAREFLHRAAYWNENNLKLIGAFHLVADLFRRRNIYLWYHCILSTDERMLHATQERDFEDSPMAAYRHILTGTTPLHEYELIYRGRVKRGHMNSADKAADIRKMATTLYEIIRKRNEEKKTAELLVFSNLRFGDEGTTAWLAGLVLDELVDGRLLPLCEITEEFPISLWLEINDRVRQNNIFVWKDRESDFSEESLLELLPELKDFSEPSSKHYLDELRIASKIAQEV